MLQVVSVHVCIEAIDHILNTNGQFLLPTLALSAQFPQNG
jgi:hypothetical protein